MEQIKNIGTLDAQLLADYILQMYGPMSHLKLQKLLYYCEGYHLGYFNSSLIKEEFEAWVHGPVCRSVYNNLKGESVIYADLGFNGTNDPQSEVINKLSTDQFQLIKDILEELSTWTGLELENATHNEKPWIEARSGYGPADKCENIISKITMQVYFKNDINA